MIRLVVNADDLGLNPRIDEGILRAHREGVVTSATLLVTGRQAEAAVAKANAQSLPLGLHLALTTHLTPAAPAKDVRWLAPGGRFRKDWAELSTAWFSQLIPREEIELELRAQVRRASELGAKIDHLDTHQHLHLLPGLTEIVEGLAIELGLPVRWPLERPTLHWLVHPRSAMKTALVAGLARVKAPNTVRRVPALGLFESGRLTERRLLRLIDELPEGDRELITHPGTAPGTVKEDPAWQYGWEDELDALLSPNVRAAIDRRGIRLVSFAELL